MLQRACYVSSSSCSRPHKPHVKLFSSHSFQRRTIKLSSACLHLQIIDVNDSMITVMPFSDYCDQGGFDMEAYMAYFKEVGSKEGLVASLPGLPLLDSNRDLPSFLTDKESHPLALWLLLDQFSNVDESAWLLFNSFDVLENEARNWLEKQWPEKVITVGPTTTSIYFNNGPTQFGSDSSFPIKWLDGKETASVVYVSFGSVAKLGEDQIEEIAWGLEKCSRSFLWVVRAEEHHKLPSEFKEGRSDKGLVVPWCSEIQDLSHKAVGCFVTHCGWNSTVEALSFGVPMVAMPQQVDQPTDTKFVEDVWKVGVRVTKDVQGITRREERVKCIDDVMAGGSRGAALKTNAMRWKQLADEAFGGGGSSDRNIGKFIARLCVS